MPIAAGIALAVGCALATAGLIVLLAPLLQQYALARPNARSSHKAPTPQGGGAAVVAVAIAGIALALAVLPVAAPVRELAIVLGAAAVLAVVGAIDDIVVMRAAPRLVVQLAAAAAVVWTLPSALRIAPFLPLVLERVVLVLAVVWFVNLVNFMDGIDWITVAEVVPITAGLVVLGALDAVPPVVTVAALALGGATLGFAPFNRPVARLFLGDVGSLPIGLLLAWLLVVTAGVGHVAAAILLPLYYLADATITLGRRLARGERVWEAHRTHFYQRATDRGYTVLAIVARVFAVNLVLAALAVASVVRPGTGTAVAAVAAGAAVVAYFLYALARGRR
jgi:UDP-N-acetylmuramyl pentapeptide phosphotransferase/UDP-N-acetylglucosamine-1-phosphate transferase